MTSQHRDQSAAVEKKAQLSPFIYVHWTEGERVLQVTTANSTQYNFTLKDKENISVQFVTITPKNMLTFETVTFIRQKLVTLHGLRGCLRTFLNTAEEQVPFLSSYNVTSNSEMLTYSTIVGYNFCTTQEELLSQRSVSLLSGYLTQGSEK